MKPEIISSQGEAITLQEPLRGILLSAIDQQVTDIHADPLGEGKLIRFRVDGVIHEHAVLHHKDRLKFLNQIKVSANIKIDKSFQPQEGQLTLIAGNGTNEVRVSIVPVGERASVSLRIMSGSKGLRNINELGLSPRDLATVMRNINQTHGMTLIAGPTGAGKSTTMYALAQAMNVRERIVCSIEDPVEYRIPGVRQIEVDEQHELTMNTGLRALLRMDADVILIGEIRDQISAVTASRAALTSRTVLASIHAASARMAIDAMRSLAVPRYLLAGALHQIIHQDLIRTLCPACARTKDNDQKELFQLAGIEAPEELKHASGCEKCHGYGYLGRTAIFEVLHINEKLRQEIALGSGDFSEKHSAKHISPLIQDALQKCADGITSLEEVKGMAIAHHQNLNQGAGHS